MGCNSSPTSKKGSNYPTTGRGDVSSVGFRQGKHTYLADDVWWSHEELTKCFTKRLESQTFVWSHNLLICPNFKKMNQSKHPKILVTSVDKNHSLSLVEKPMEKPSIHLTSLTQKPRDFPAKTPPLRVLLAPGIHLPVVARPIQTPGPEIKSTRCVQRKPEKKKKPWRKKQLKSLVIYCMCIYIYGTQIAHKVAFKKKNSWNHLPSEFLRSWIQSCHLVEWRSHSYDHSVSHLSRPAFCALQHLWFVKAILHMVPLVRTGQWMGIIPENSKLPCQFLGQLLSIKSWNLKTFKDLHKYRYASCKWNPQTTWYLTNGCLLKINGPYNPSLLTKIAYF